VSLPVDKPSKQSARGASGAKNGRDVPLYEIHGVDLSWDDPNGAFR